MRTYYVIMMDATPSLFEAGNRHHLTNPDPMIPNRWVIIEDEGTAREHGELHVPEEDFASFIRILNRKGVQGVIMRTTDGYTRSLTTKELSQKLRNFHAKRRQATQPQETEPILA